jgi:hypothetical protein
VFSALADVSRINNRDAREEEEKRRKRDISSLYFSLGLSNLMQPKLAKLTRHCFDLYFSVVVDRIRGSGLEGSSLLSIFAGERKGSSPWAEARAFKSADRRKHQLDFQRISTNHI